MDLRYLHNRGITDTSESRVGAFLGDGECDEPESLGSLSTAAREELDNLVFVINCNLQRLDGPVRGNGKIIQELEGQFRGAGWNVIKVIWGPEWDELLEKDEAGVLRRRMNEVVDGAFKKYTTSDGAYIRQHFFGSDPRLNEMVSHLSDEQLTKLRRGGHRYRKIYAAYDAAVKTKGKPTVILAHTFKGWTLGPNFEGSNEPVDKGRVLYYREAKNGQVLEEGITEAGSMASFTAASTAYSTVGEPMIPFYIFYSMFGFQRTGDQMWACCDAMGRGFLLGATAGRTTLNGEGLQHEDGHSQLLAATYPSIVSYDVSFAFELASIVQDGMRRMFEERENIYYYITLQNENYPMPPMPKGAKEGILKGMYLYQKAKKQSAKHVQLFGSGSIMLQVLRAAEILQEKYGVNSDIWGVTSYQQLRREAVECDRYNRLHPEATPRVSYVTQSLKGREGPVIAASDYMTLVQDQIARWVPQRYVALGCDGFGMSDTREALRRHFEVDAESITLAALDALRLEGKIKGSVVTKAFAELGVDPEKPYSAHV